MLLSFLFWLCGTHKCSMVSTILKPLSARSVLLRKSARMRVALSADSQYSLLWLFSEVRQASERREFAH